MSRASVISRLGFGAMWHSPPLRWLGLRVRAFAASEVRLPPVPLGLVIVAWCLMLVHGLLHRNHAAGGTLAFEWLAWNLMVVAMMWPFLGPTLAEVRRTCFPHLRRRAQSLYLVGWLGPWLLFGVLAAQLRSWQPLLPTGMAGVAFVLAAFWNLTPLHSNALQACHLTRALPPFGSALLQGAWLEGSRAGANCCLSCGPLMLACTLTGHHWLAMVGGFLIGWLERASYRPSFRLGSVLAALMAVLCFFGIAQGPASALSAAASDGPALLCGGAAAGP